MNIYKNLVDAFEKAVNPCKGECLIEGVKYVWVNTYDVRNNSIRSATASIPEIGFKFEIKRIDATDEQRLLHVYKMCKITAGHDLFKNLCRREKAAPEKVSKRYGRDAAIAWSNVDHNSISEVKEYFEKYIY